MLESEVELVPSPGPLSHQPDGVGDPGHIGGGRDGYTPGTRRSFTPDKLVASERSQLIPSQGGGEPEKQTGNSLPQTPRPAQGNGNADATVRRPTSLSPLPCPSVRQQPCSPRMVPVLPGSPGTNYKSAASQLSNSPGEDVCLHCVLACLFCELLSFCGTLECGGTEGGTTPAGGGGCCCSGGAEGCGAAEEACPWGGGCGLLHECCGTGECVEICLECCSICFPA
ncbi:uncharacterized protein [Mobula birostris]|uniref:uncharacterized protein n=1 Tax=Mobula birostris TaxID=1983395 RepID=UPI003B285338